MHLKEYTSFFHDGSVIAIDHIGNNAVFYIESAEIDREDLDAEGISYLTKNSRIKGKIYIYGIINIEENDKRYFGKLKMKTNDAEIFHLEINRNKVEFQIKWSSHQSKLDDFSTIEITAEKIEWIPEK
jgi:hypothetical protein